MSSELPLRHAGRVLLIDPDDRVLLFRSQPRPADGRHFWFPVGGEVEPGETHAEAAAREAFEETGLRDLVIGPEVFTRRFVFTWRNTVWDARERWFVARVAYFEPVFDGMEEVEIGDFSDCRWMSLALLRAVQAHGDILTPKNLLKLLPGFLAGEYPSEPLAVGE